MPQLNTTAGKTRSVHRARDRLFRRHIIATFALFSLATPASAQVVPDAAQPDQIEKRFIPPPAPRAGAPAVIPAPRAPEPAADLEKLKFTLKALRVEGATIYTDDDLRPLFASLIDQETTLAAIYTVAQEITALYRNNGYILSIAVVPPQRIRDGVVRIRVVEGFVDQVTIDGDIYDSLGMLETYGNKIKAMRPLKASVLERYLLLANDLPGLTVTGVLNPSKSVTGASDLVFRVTQNRIAAAASIDNRGSRYLGPYQGQVMLDVNSPFGFMGRTRIQGIGATQFRELKSIEGSHEIHIGGEGTRLTVRGRRTETRPGFTLSRFEVEGDTTYLAAKVAHPVIRSRNRNLTLSGRFTYRNTETQIFGQKLSEDRIRALRAAAEFDVADRHGGITWVRAEVSQGLNIMNATEPRSADLTRASGRSNFTKTTLDLYRLQRVTDRWSVLGEATGQYAFSQLLSSEEFGFGGARFGRAFDPAEFLGDHGAAFKLEPRFTNAPTVAALRTVLRTYQLYGYGDWGRAWHIDNTNRRAFDTGASAGAGLRLTLANGVRLSFEASKPMIRDVAARGGKGRRIRFFFNAAIALN